MEVPTQEPESEAEGCPSEQESLEENGVRGSRGGH